MHHNMQMFHVQCCNISDERTEQINEWMNEWKRKQTNTILHHNNICQNVSNFVLNFLQKKGIRTVPHPPYSLDLAYCNFSFKNWRSLQKMVYNSECTALIPSFDTQSEHVVQTILHQYFERNTFVYSQIYHSCKHTCLITFWTVFIHYMFTSCDSLQEKNHNETSDNVSCGLDTKCQRNFENYATKIFIVWAFHPFFISVINSRSLIQVKELSI
jgi:hypothetical protein